MIRFYHTKLFRAIKIKEKEEKMLKEKVKLNSEKINIRERRIKALKLGLLISLLFLIIIYVILRIVYTQGAFTIALNQNFAKKSGLIMYENGEIKLESGAHIPTVITSKRTGSYGHYELVEYWEPRDGSYYAEDIKEKFPLHLHSEALDSQRYIDEQIEFCDNAAKDYFSSSSNVGGAD